jgi:hypothetical protein
VADSHRIALEQVDGDLRAPSLRAPGQNAPGGRVPPRASRFWLG